jgi:hypothetical protein
MTTLAQTRASSIAQMALGFSLRGEPDRSERLLRCLPHGDPAVSFNLGWHLLRHGDLQGGIALMDAGREVGVFGSLPVTFCPRWDGNADIKDKVVSLRGEGGLGDQIVSARFALPLAERGAKVVFSCSSALKELMLKAPGIYAVVNQGADVFFSPEFYIPGMSAALPLGFTFDDLPGHPYLPIPTPKRTDDRLRVGIRWRGLPAFEHEQHRSFPPDALFSLADIEGVSLVSLQRDEGSELLPAGIAETPRLTSWSDTARAIAGLDLVVSSCTSVAHLSAAMGIKTWVIVPVMPYYLWAHPWGGDTSPWHQTVRLFRQKKYGDWSEPLTRVIESIREGVLCRT